MGKLVLWYGGNFNNVSKLIKPVLEKNGTPYELQQVQGTALPVLSGGDLGMAMGNKAYQALVAHEVVPKNRTVTSLRGTLFRLPMLQRMYCTFDPTIVNYDPARKPEIEWDYNLAHRLLTTGSVAPAIGDYRFVADFTDVLAKIKEIYKRTKKRVQISIDLETLGLNPYAEDAYIVSISVTVHQGHADIVKFSKWDDEKQPGFRENHQAWMLNEKLWHQINILINDPAVWIT